MSKHCLLCWPLWQWDPRVNFIPCEKLFSSLCFLKPTVWSFHHLCLNSLVARNSSPILGHDLIIANFCWLQHLPASWWGNTQALKSNPLLGIRCATIAILFPARAQSMRGSTHRPPKKNSSQADTTVCPGVSLHPPCANEWSPRQWERQVLQEANLLISFPAQGMQANKISMDFIYSLEGTVITVTSPLWLINVKKCVQNWSRYRNQDV